MKVFNIFFFILIQISLIAVESIEPFFDFENTIDLVKGKWEESGVDLTTVGANTIELKRHLHETPRSESFLKNWTFNLPDFGKKDQVRKKLKRPENQNLIFNHDEEGRLIRLEVQNSEEWLEITYGADTCKVESNGGDYILYGISSDSHLMFVEKSDRSRCAYTYIPDPLERSSLLSEKKETGMWIKFSYYEGKSRQDFRVGKLKEIFCSQDQGETFTRICRLDYEPGITSIWDTANVLNRYHYNADSKFTCIETILPENPDSIYRTQELEWEGGKLIRKTVNDGFGSLILQQRFVFDKKNNLIEDVLEGSLTSFQAGNEAFRKQFNYDDKNRLIEEKEEGSFSTSYFYKGDSKKPSSKFVWDQKTLQERTDYTYDAEGRVLETWVDDSLHIKKFERICAFNEFNQPTEIQKGYLDQGEEVLKDWILFFYDAKGRKTKETNLDGLGKEVAWTETLYAFDGSIQEVTTSSGSHLLFTPGKKHFFDQQSEKLFTYSPQNKLLSEETYRNGNKASQTTYTYDSLGQLISRSENGGPPTTYAYDSLGRKIKETSPAILLDDNTPFQASVTYVYDALDRVIETIDSDGALKQTFYNIRNQPVLTIDPDGAFEEKHYTLSGRLEREIFQDKSFHTYSYDSLGRVLKKSFYNRDQEEVLCQEYVYSGSLLYKELFSSGISILYTYDSAGRKIEAFCPETGRKAVYSYGNRGELLQQKEWVDADNFIIKNIDQPEITSQTEPEISFVVNSRGQTVLQHILTEEERHTTVLYDALGRPEQIDTYHVNGSLILRRHLRHDKRGNKIRETLETLEKCIKNRWEYDRKNNLLLLIENEGDSDERMTSYTYELGNLATQTSCDGISIHYTYDANHRLIGMRSSDGSIHDEMTYDKAGRLCTAKDHVHHLLTARTYNLEGQLIEETLGNGSSIQNTYDLLGRRTSLTLPDLSTISYRFEEEDLVEIIRKDQKGNRCYSHLHTSEDTADLIMNLGSLKYERDDKGRITKLESPYFNQNAAYDNQNRLISLETSDPEGIYQNHYSYTGRQGLSEEGAYKRSYRFDSFENFIIEPKDELQYDLRGNLIKKGNFKFNYDALNRLTQVFDQDEIIHEYVYDVFHRRLSDSKREDYLYDGNWDIGSKQANGHMNIRVFDSSNTPEHAKCIAFEIQGKVYAPIYHITGSLAVLVEASSKHPVEFFRYTAFGECEQTGSIAPWQYANKRKDTQTGLIHFGRRDYDPSLGRFTTPDPLGFGDGANRYSYCHNDPLNRMDYLGLKSSSYEWEAFKEDVENFFEMIKEKILGVFQVMKENSHLGGRDIYEHMAGNGYLLLSGYSSTVTSTGCYGKGELSPLVRVSFINGILTDSEGLLANVSALSECHGNVNIHYVYRPTSGWVRDILHSFAVGLGLISDEARTLAGLWQNMISEMGGIEGGGKIIHYAHSIGSIETMRALSLLSEEEQKLIHVYAFGAPNLAEENPNYQVRHFASIRDGVCYLNIIAFIQACCGGLPNVVFTGTLLGIPFVDHLFRNQTYQDIWKSMGRTFTEWYGVL